MLKVFKVKHSDIMYIAMLISITWKENLFPVIITTQNLVLFVVIKPICYFRESVFISKD